MKISISLSEKIRGLCILSQCYKWSILWMNHVCFTSLQLKQWALISFKIHKKFLKILQMTPLPWSFPCQVTSLFYPLISICWYLSLLTQLANTPKTTYSQEDHDFLQNLDSSSCNAVHVTEVLLSMRSWMGVSPLAFRISWSWISWRCSWNGWDSNDSREPHGFCLGGLYIMCRMPAYPPWSFPDAFTYIDILAKRWISIFPPGPSLQLGLCSLNVWRTEFFFPKYLQVIVVSTLYESAFSLLAHLQRQEG